MTYEQALAIAVGRGVSLKPVLFSAPMVQAILEDRKTQTRRVIKPQPIKVFKENGVDVLIDDGRTNAGKRPYAEGDILWVRETWRCMGFDDEIEEPKMLIQYRDESSRWVAMRNYARFKKFAVCWAGWKPSIFMPREAARLFLEVKSVRVERLQDISEEDANAEGFIFGCDSVDWFHDYWDSLNAKRGCSWDSNPWVWVIEFERVEGKR